MEVGGGRRMKADEGGQRRRWAEARGGRRTPAEVGGGGQRHAEAGGHRRRSAEASGGRRRPAEVGGAQRRPAEAGGGRRSKHQRVEAGAATNRASCIVRQTKRTVVLLWVRLAGGMRWTVSGVQPGNHVVGDEECGVDEDDVEEEKSEREREREDREESMHDYEGGESQQYYEEDDGGDGENDDAYPVVDEDGRQEWSVDVEVDDATGERSEASVLKRKRESLTSPTTAADKRPAKELTLAASQQALRASEEAVAESVKKQKGGSSRVVSEKTQPSANTHDEAIDTTRCFFLEFDEDGLAKKKREYIEVDVTKILPIPGDDILFNHRTLDEMLVQSIYDAIHNAAKETNGKWDFMTFILAPIVPNRDGSQGRRITPEQFDVELAHTYNWYAVAGQHTTEAMNRLITDKSPDEKVYGLRSYSHVRVVYFDDDTKRGYPYVSTFDNTREERSIPISFLSSVRQMRTFWDKRNDRIHPPGTVSPNDVEGMKQKKKWEAFMNAACKITPDSSLMNSSLKNDYCKDWTNKMRGYMNLAQCSETVRPLVQKFFDMYEKGLLP
ncbi:hypothetical protein CBR_g32383 [Chara braunii]|uniref:Uncharacterized protein n=1 Tax=Chara braunii TaxID=69332 RepID=A0A388JYA0_CHABU|nr:hypothetical protein CBR_g32383 [Chara braunii]|eukprot:GBG62794.1 hypothetical protein CBR_g32383 [Chara braunii]